MSPVQNLAMGSQTCDFAMNVLRLILMSDEAVTSPLQQVMAGPYFGDCRMNFENPTQCKSINDFPFPS